MDQLRKMKLHGQFGRDKDDKKSGKSWHWVRNRNLKRETKLVVSSTGASLKHQLKTIFHKDFSNKCKLCGTHVENVLHIVSDCSMLAQKEHKRRHDKVSLNIHWVHMQKAWSKSM